MSMISRGAPGRRRSPRQDGRDDSARDGGPAADAPPPDGEVEAGAPGAPEGSGDEVVEPPTLAKPPASPWSDGFGRTAVRSAQTLLVVALVALVVYAAVQLRVVVIPVLIAAVLAAAAAPLVGWLGRRGVPRALGTALVFLALAVVIGLVGWGVVSGVRGSWDELRQSATAGLDQLQQLLTSDALPISEAQVQQARDTVVNFLTGASFRSGALAGVNTVTQVITGAVLALFVLFFFLKDGPSIWSFLISGVHGPRHRRLEHVGEASVGVLGGYVRGTAAVAFVDAVLIGAGIAILGVPLALPLALVTFVAAFVPIVGAVAAGVLAALVALVTNGLVTALIVVGIIVVVQQLESNILQPFLLGRALSLHPLAILLALTAGTILAGIIGAVLSVPLAAVAWTAAKAWNEDKRTSHAALTHQAPGGPPAAAQPDPAPSA